MIAYKLCRLLKNGDITSLFINKKVRLCFNEWLDAESHPTKGYKLRPVWHCVLNPEAPHLTKSGRVWVEVEVDNYDIVPRPKNQGGHWVLAKRIKLLKTM